MPRALLQLSTSTCVPYLVRTWIALADSLPGPTYNSPRQFHLGRAGGVQLTTTPAGATFSPHSALSWVTFPEDSTAMFKLWCFVNWGSQASKISVLFLPPRAQLQFSTSFCVPLLEGVRDALDVSPLVPHFICEMSLELGASYSSPRQPHLIGIRDVSKALTQLWLSNQFGSQVSVSSGSFELSFSVGEQDKSFVRPVVSLSFF